MATFGLTLNFLGALLLVIGSSIQTGVITNIIDTIAGKYGTWSMEPINSELITKFRGRKNLSKWLNVVGYILFIIGFGLQLYGDE